MEKCGLSLFFFCLLFPMFLDNPLCLRYNSGIRSFIDLIGTFTETRGKCYDLSKRVVAKI